MLFPEMGSRAAICPQNKNSLKKLMTDLTEKTVQLPKCKLYSRA
jgi:hypothetical protein